MPGARAPSTISSGSLSHRPTVDRIVTSFARYEALLREAHVVGLELGLDLRRVQEDADLAPVAGYKVFAKLDTAQAGISGAISDTAAGHVMVRAMAPRVGVDPTAFGEKCPPLDSPEEFFRSTGQLGTASAA